MHNKSVLEKQEKEKAIAEENMIKKSKEAVPTGNTLLQQMVSAGQILTPEPVQQQSSSQNSSLQQQQYPPQLNHLLNDSSNAHSKQNCDSNSSHNGPKPIRKINPNDFDYNDSSPFDTLELKTINEREELYKLFRTINVDGNSASNTVQNSHNILASSTNFVPYHPQTLQQPQQQQPLPPQLPPTLQQPQSLQHQQIPLQHPQQQQHQPFQYPNYPSWLPPSTQ